MKYISVHLCPACETRLTRDQRFYSDGVCPYCGDVTLGTIVDTRKISIVKKKPWWNWFLFWRDNV